MVRLEYALLKKFVEARRKSVPFLDSLRLFLRGGHGGNGFPKYGGVGGQGGCVYFVAKEDVTLRKIMQKFPTKRIAAPHGEDASKNRILGRRGVDKEIEVPMGVRVLDETGKSLAELNENGCTFLAAGGGGGGCAGNSFIGHKGQNSMLRLDLKLIADVGLVGFPNAGKSTLLKAISKASPKIASYPFTTIRPQIGVIEFSDHRQITVADLPGLIEGAHANIGMGHQFLKHVERTRLLLLIVDIAGFQLSKLHIDRTCLENVYALNKELELYDPLLLEKPSILLVNKMDCEGSTDKWNNLKGHLHNLSDGLAQCPESIRPTRLLKFRRIIPISAKNRTSTDRVEENVREVLDEEAASKLSEGDHLDFDEKMKEIGPKVF